MTQKYRNSIEKRKSNDYKRLIIEMVGEIETLDFLESIYWFTKVLYDKNKKQGKNSTMRVRG